jgi:hypothetical protein
MAQIRVILLLGGAAMAAVAVQSACGPSVQTIYEGNVRFEHCYRLDLDTTKAPSHRHACWRNWLQVYTYAQPRDRIEYARRRVRSLEIGDPDRPVLNLARTRPNEPRSWYLSGPAPVNAHSPPPATVNATEPRAARADADAGPLPPAEQCTATCRVTWRDCLAPCSGPDAGTAPECVRCEPDYLACMRRCLE